ncbi:hypothetical protein, partial [Aeromonas veronii]|uniref:hypothetical protein n=2 Tax=Aeromonadaceae TaxID=84642 RepID=UPI0038B54E40
HFLEMAKLIGYPFPDYKKAEEIPPEMVAMQGILESPELVELMIRKQSGEEINEAELFRLMLNNPKVAQPFIKAMVKSGDISFGQD